MNNWGVDGKLLKGMDCILGTLGEVSAMFWAIQTVNTYLSSEWVTLNWGEMVRKKDTSRKGQMKDAGRGGGEIPDVKGKILWTAKKWES